ncbi:hypothetical protein BD408DRAFT_445422 [Parasitella parasitica]|nr:hypothetical protein BD408DRAFT_445422 [Parasitella parasitica]
MSDLNWCTFCDNAKFLYCSDQCLKADALRNHPLFGYKYPECTNFFTHRSRSAIIINGSSHRLPPSILSAIAKAVSAPLIPSSKN